MTDESGFMKIPFMEVRIQRIMVISLIESIELC